MEARITECFNTCKEAWEFVEKLQAQNVHCENPRLIVVDGALYGGEGEVFYTVDFVADPTKY